VLVRSVRFELFPSVLVAAFRCSLAAKTRNASSRDFTAVVGKLWASCGHGLALPRWTSRR